MAKNIIDRAAQNPRGRYAEHINQQDYIFLIQQALKLLAPEGVIYFSTNFRKFKFDISIFPQIDCVDISQKTIPFDFHNQKIHYCFKITRKRI
jgi:23S rRNA G2069 N7-methylase RlmK/C1962 C5-methylase RlmI